jgi:hypothetical protein
LQSVAKAGVKYPQNHWTPETWYKAVLDLPIAEDSVRSDIESHVRNMEAWKWMLIPIFFAGIVAFAIAVMAKMKERKGGSIEYPADKESPAYVA